MKTLGIYFSNPKKSGYPFDTRNYCRAYFDLSWSLKKLGIDVIFVRGPKSYLGQGKFSHGWKFGKESAELIAHRKSFRVNAIFNRGYGLSIFEKERNVPILNYVALDRICTDKWRTYRLFREVSPQTILVSSFVELRKKIK